MDPFDFSTVPAARSERPLAADSTNDVFFSEAVYRSGPAGGVAVEVPQQDCSELGLWRPGSDVGSARPPALAPPPLPSSPFELDHTHARCAAPPAQVLAGLCRALASHPSAVVAEDRERFQVCVPVPGRAPPPAARAPPPRCPYSACLCVSAPRLRPCRCPRGCYETMWASPWWPSCTPPATALC